MRTKKRWYFVWMLVFVLLVFVGCGEITKPPEETSPGKTDVQKDFVEKAIEEIVKNMKPDGPRSNEKKIQRSLAQYILKDHIALMAYFQSQEFSKMEYVMGNARVYINDENGDPLEEEDPNEKFWKKLYAEKAAACPDAASIELEIYADDISLEDIDPIKDETDCSSTEVFLFRIIALDENGDEISNQIGGGSRSRRHSGVCPWV